MTKSPEYCELGFGLTHRIFLRDPVALFGLMTSKNGMVRSIYFELNIGFRDTISLSLGIHQNGPGEWLLLLPNIG